VRTIFNFKIHYIEEKVPHNTYGGILHFKETILEDNPNYIFIMHCAICCSFPLYDMLKFHEAHGKLATALTTSVPPETTKDYGVVTFDKTTLELTYYKEYPQ